MSAEIIDFNIAEFREKVAENAPNEAVRDAIYELLQFSLIHADRITGGKSQIGSYLFIIKINTTRKTLFFCDSYGYIQIAFGNFHGPLISRMHTRLSKIPGFDNLMKDYPDRPGFSVSNTLVDPQIMNVFQQAVRHFKIGIQS
jgi:hypothetical protein